MIDREILKDMLINEFNYPEFMLIPTLNKLDNLDEGLKEDFETWFHTKQIPDVKVKEYTLKYLMENYEMNVIGGFLTLDWLIKDYASAAAALKKGVK